MVLVYEDDVYWIPFLVYRLCMKINPSIKVGQMYDYYFYILFLKGILSGVFIMEFRVGI